MLKYMCNDAPEEAGPVRGGAGRGTGPPQAGAGGRAGIYYGQFTREAFHTAERGRKAGVNHRQGFTPGWRQTRGQPAKRRPRAVVGHACGVGDCLTERRGRRLGKGLRVRRSGGLRAWQKRRGGGLRAALPGGEGYAPEAAQRCAFRRKAPPADRP